MVITLTIARSTVLKFTSTVLAQNRAVALAGLQPGDPQAAAGPGNKPCWAWGALARAGGNGFRERRPGHRS